MTIPTLRASPASQARAQPLPPRGGAVPAVILVRPQMGENIGAAARAMSNFGLSELRLVAPRDGWPNRRALEMAAGGGGIIEAAKSFPDFASATADIQRAYATTARPRDMNKRVLTPEAATGEIVQYLLPHLLPPPNPFPQGEGEIKIALVFGPERTGLENEEINWCDTLVTIPTAPENSSLNLAQSVVVMGYEWFRQVSGSRIQDSGENHLLPESRIPNPESLATKEDWGGLFDQLSEYLDDINY
ncbi:MAG: RNA methyltransferase [Pseudomonadota bacterium]|nr:RNA methyltransferase [Pseudomonadota bacterium]